MSQVTNYTDNIQEVKLVDLTKSIVAFDKLLAHAVHFIKHNAGAAGYQGHHDYLGWPRLFFPSSGKLTERLLALLHWA